MKRLGVAFLSYLGILWALWKLYSDVQEWSEKLANLLEITSTNWRFVLSVGLFLITLAVIFGVFKWGYKLFGKKTVSISMAQKKQEDEFNPNEIKNKIENKINIGLKEMQVVVLPEKVQHTIYMREGLNFEWDFMYIGSLFKWAYELLYGKTYEANIAGSIEGRIDLTRVEVKVDPPKKAAELEEIKVNVSIPAGYFMANFGFMGGYEEIQNTAGVATDHYKVSEIQAAFAEQYPRIVREFIESKNMIALTKETTKSNIERFIKGFMAALDFKDLPPFKKYEVEAAFIPDKDKWEIFEGVTGEKLGEIIDTSGQQNETSSEEQENVKQSAKS